MSSSTTSGHWSQALTAAMSDPQQILDSDDQIVIIKDKYPKALYHFLVLPRRKMPNLRNMTKNDLDLLKYMHNKGEAFANRANKELKFRFGYHAIPSMSHLHMHIISQDFNSLCLKTVKHWNSFNTKNFVDSADLIKEIETKGRFEIDQEEISLLLKKDLSCHVCKQSFSTLPKLKDHIVLHDVTRRENK
ncbi:aprataxin [Biomphalaria pfeifferi]|uniref:Aprataxin n=1 Tax=Biomphalaria pfeifferi TaxID=112525 RepID=A0AAD8B6I2_BIOPF|nr:aprataxin [Biomphalaria pfeifferi]